MGHILYLLIKYMINGSFGFSVFIAFWTLIALRHPDMSPKAPVVAHNNSDVIVINDEEDDQLLAEQLQQVLT